MSVFEAYKLGDHAKRTEVVRTPQFSEGGCSTGAAGVSMNSKSSGDSA